MSVKPDDLSIAIHGMWPNVGRVVYVDRLDPAIDFSAMGLGVKPGWRVRAWGSAPLETIKGPRMAGFTPVGSLKPLDDLSPEHRESIRCEMALLDFQDDMNDLSKIFEMQYETEDVAA